MGHDHDAGAQAQLGGLASDECQHSQLVKAFPADGTGVDGFGVVGIWRGDVLGKDDVVRADYRVKTQVFAPAPRPSWTRAPKWGRFPVL